AYPASEDVGTAVAIDLTTGNHSPHSSSASSPKAWRSANAQWAYVTAKTSNSVSVIATKKNSVVANSSADVIPRAVAWAPDRSRVYVSNQISGTLAVIHGHTHALTSLDP